ncbi:MAG TPA: hypothetical protein VEF76_13020 [Patescibacteria group bacterium]|nr:hypothetical protein [Patescibacteria group bacterium]
MSTVKLEEVAAEVAQQKAMERGPLFLPHGCRLFQVTSGWEANMIRHDKGVVSCETLLELEAGLQDPGAKVLFIPLNAIIVDKDVEKLCQRNGVAKTLFKEVKGTT